MLTQESHTTFVIHEGPLTVSSLDSNLSQSIFRPYGRPQRGDAEDSDPFHLGWEYVSEEDNYHFGLKNLYFPTAEGVATLATVVESLRQRRGGEVVVELDQRSKQWSKALHLDELIEARWSDELPNDFLKVSGCYMFPLWRQIIREKDVPQNLAAEMSRRVQLLLREMKYADVGEVGTAIRLVLKEAIQNVYEHAYRREENRVMFGAITATPFPRRDQLLKCTYAAEEELVWFDRFVETGMMLEVAIADYGKTVPVTLWRAFSHKHRRRLDLAKNLALGSKEGLIERAKLHYEIAQWSFDHASTRKSPEDFPNELAFLNWRGLHRALNTCAKLNGCMVMRSGQARCGYAFKDHSVTSLKQRILLPHDFPGTSIIIRFPIVKTKDSRTTAVKIPAEKPEIHLKLEKIINHSEVPADVRVVPTGGPRLLGIVYPFRTYKDDTSDLKHRLTEISPSFVTIHLFARADRPLLHFLQSLDRDYFSSGLGPPRIMALWSPSEPFYWKVAGRLPECALPIVDSLETNGVAQVGSDPESISFAQELVRTYSPMVTLEDNSLHLTIFNGNIAPKAIHEALQLAFEIWSEEYKKFWF